MKNFKITRANFWRMIGFYCCFFFALFLLVTFVLLFEMPLREDASTVDFWGIRYIQFLALVAAGFYAFMAKKNLERAHLLDNVQTALCAYYRCNGTEEEHRRLWNEYMRLNALANQ